MGSGMLIVDGRSWTVRVMGKSREAWSREGGKWWKSLEGMLVQPLLLLQSGRKVGPWMYSPKLTAQKHQLMYSLAVGLCCAKSKRSCCAVRLLISEACVHALTYTLGGGFSQRELEPNEWGMRWKSSWMSRLKNKRMGIWTLSISGEGERRGGDVWCAYDGMRRWGDEISSGGERGRGHCVFSEGGNDRTRTRTHLEATGLVTAGGFLIQVSQPWETARVSPYPRPLETQPVQQQSVPWY